MSKHKEFWIQADKKDVQTFEYLASDTEQYEDDIHVIEYEAYAEMKQLCSELVAVVETYEFSLAFSSDELLKKARKVLKDEI